MNVSIIIIWKKVMFRIVKFSNFTTTIIDNPPLLSSKFPLLDSLSIETSDLETNSLRVIKLKNTMKEVNRVSEDN